MICIPGHHNRHVTEISEPRLVAPYICYVYSSLIQGRFNIVRLNEWRNEWMNVEEFRARIHFTFYLGPLHTRDREPVTVTLQGLSLVENVEPVQVCFTLHLRDPWSMWVQDGCKVYMDSYVASNGSCFMVTWIISKTHLLEVGLTRDLERPWHSDCSWPLIYF